MAQGPEHLGRETAVPGAAPPDRRQDEPGPTDAVLVRPLAEAFVACPMAARRARIIAGFYAACGIGALLTASLGWTLLAVGLLSLAALAALAWLALGDVPGKHLLLAKAWQVVRTARRGDWLLGLLGLALAGGVLVLLNLVGLMLGMAAIAIGLVLLLRWTLDRQVAEQRRPLVARAQRLLAALPGSGQSDRAAESLVWRHGGANVEPLFESLFGYESLLDARFRWPAQDPAGRPRRHHRWRDPIARWLDARRLARWELDPPAASAAPTPVGPAAAPAEPVQPRSPHGAAAVGPEPAANLTEPGDMAPAPVARRRAEPGAPLPAAAPHVELADDPRQWGRAIVPGPRLRLAIGALLVAGCLLWMHQNALLPSGAAAETGAEPEVTGRLEQIRQIGSDVLRRLDARAKPTRPLHLEPLPGIATGWIDGYTSGAAGLLLLVSVLFTDLPAGVAFLAAAVLMLLGDRLPRPASWPVPPGAVGIAAGLVLLVVGMLARALARRLAPLLAPAGSPGQARPHRIALLNARGQVLHAAPAPGSSAGSPTPQLLRRMLCTAITARASDIHAEPAPAGGVVRMRVDGTLVDVCQVDPIGFPRLLNLVKVLADIDITKQRAVQEGHFSAAIGGHRIDYRVSFSPSLRGHKLAIRVLDAAGVPRRLDQLGLAGELLEPLRRFAASSAGMLMVSGPTGAGKTTTLYAMLHEIDVKRRNVITIEDPVEHRLGGVTQIPVDESAGNSFSRLLGAVLHQDPDVILVGEIRDAETARTAMQAAMTGHLVLSTIHARDSVGAILRLLDLGASPGQVAAGLSLVLAQRLVRQLCPRCRVARPADPAALAALGATGTAIPQVQEPGGCRHCLQTGYFGRRALLELLVLNDALRQVIPAAATADALRRALDPAMPRLADMGRQLVAGGITSVAEFLHATADAGGGGA